MGTAQASAVAMLAGARAGLPVQTYTPSEVKAAVTGSGQADKAQVTTMVTRLLRLPTRRPGRPTPPTRWRWPSATSGAAARRPGSKAGRRRPPEPGTARRSTMIASVRGRVTATVSGRTPWSRSAGSAWPCTAPRRRSPSLRVGEEARLATSLVVREDSLTLYGFADDDARALFELLQTASGVGPAAGPGGARGARPGRGAQGRSPPATRPP